MVERPDPTVSGWTNEAGWPVPPPGHDDGERSTAKTVLMWLGVIVLAGLVIALNIAWTVWLRS